MMNIYKTEPFTKGRISIFRTRDEREAQERIELYIVSFLKKVYGQSMADNFNMHRNKYVFSRDDWVIIRDKLECGHYFVQRDEIGYDVYCIYNIHSFGSSWFGNEYTFIEKTSNKLFGIFCESTEEVLLKSFLDISTDVEKESYYINMPIEKRLAVEAAEVAKKFYNIDIDLY